MIYADARYFDLVMNESLELTGKESSEGWHFCYSEWDCLLTGPGMPEFEVCRCVESTKGSK